MFSIGTVIAQLALAERRQDVGPQIVGVILLR